MEAPNKIYMTPSFGEPDNVLLALFSKSHLDFHRDIEYTRTDALLRKAKEWFIEHVNISQDVATNENGEPLADSYIKYAKARLDAANEMFENFKNYIKGE